MNQEAIQFTLVVVQILTLIALIIYVIKTWHIASATKESAKVSQNILEDMKETRDQETAPYVIAYFDLNLKNFIIDLVIKNIGKTLAKEVKIEFEPKLESTTAGDINETSLIKNGIRSIPPGYEIKTFFDIGNSYFANEKLPLSYSVKITYKGGTLNKYRTYNFIMDLSAYKGLSVIHEKGIHDLVGKVESLVTSHKGIKKELEKIANNLTNGIWIKNTEFITTNLRSELTGWESITLAKLNEFKTLWTKIYECEEDKLKFISGLKNKISIIGAQILAIASNSPRSIDKEISKKLVIVSTKLSELENVRFYMDGGKSFEGFNTKGNEIVTIIDKIIKQIESNSSIKLDKT